MSPLGQLGRVRALAALRDAGPCCWAPRPSCCCGETSVMSEIRAKTPLMASTNISRCGADITSGRRRHVSPTHRVHTDVGSIGVVSSLAIRAQIAALIARGFLGALRHGDGPLRRRPNGPRCYCRPRPRCPAVDRGPVGGVVSDIEVDGDPHEDSAADFDVAIACSRHGVFHGQSVVALLDAVRRLSTLRPPLR